MNLSRVLLDTHALIWANLDPEKLSKEASAIILDPVTSVMVSAASAWEIATKVRLGKLPGAEVFEREFLEIPKRTGYILLPITVEVSLHSGRLSGPHKDPFDRMIAAQALELDIPVISRDAALDGFGVRRVW